MNTKYYHLGTIKGYPLKHLCFLPIYLSLMGLSKFSITFFSSSTTIFDAIPDTILKKWDFHLVNILPPKHPNLNPLVKIDLIIIDTYNLGLDFLELIKRNPRIGNCPTLVIDEYDEETFISEIFKKGASEYLHIDHFNDNFEKKIERMINQLPNNTSSIQ